MLKPMEKHQPYITERGAGILLHITSLPSNFGIGDVGPQAIRFADFLAQSGQKYWQLLPLNPTSAETGHSPYSSISSMAGNTLLISPETLVRDGILSKTDLKKFALPSSNKVSYSAAEKAKQELFRIAYANFQQGEFSALKKEFKKFITKESAWLDDFATYVVLKNHHDDKPWYEWPTGYKKRKPVAVSSFVEKNHDAIEYVQWLQFIFHHQWKELKQHCESINIRLFGDLPFYVSHDSVDVWSNPGIFKLDKSGYMSGVAGVPPDYFNDEGQRWGMPVFRWDVLKENQYEWWLQRLQKNMEFYNLLRLDHFRAFADYWEVPAKEATAKKGKWRPGPGASFFESAREQFNDLPFVAEDLGDINDAVYKLRDEFELPGMRVLQFAFDEHMAESPYIPHNYTPNSVVYTGTHDNNTTRGWYRKDADKASIKRLIDYAQRDVQEQNVHDVLAQIAYGSVANTVILPLQDVLGLTESARMNMPASTKNNWLWRMDHDMLGNDVIKKLSRWVKTYGR